ncbi:DUF5928 domain-containing protein [Tropicimonas sediminicola]|uniref:Peptide O-xylosyltransferase n=1 Tax=Tropicimonas sediminicola TaxID=1031541 RepID=A0A239CLW6_9RHOB|nr:DUF5928 domain-containing protein [Tropicimonas sediminicola]SNS21100.1 Core-2/I-Branching enzyme [Tropicimonas sediminicola]
MVQIAYILLCHKDPDAVVAQARRLTAAGDCVSIHFDARAPRALDAAIRTELDDNPNVTFAARRYKCGWGEWSLVAATLEAVRAAVAAFPQASHFYMLSGDCLPVKSAEYTHAFLAAEDVDYIESVDFHDGGWIKTGFREERLIYRHLFNERKRKRLFYASLEVQKRLGLTREVPPDLQVMIGSQWWCLRRSTIEAVLAFCTERPDVLRFFSTTWIPDETFFQTLVRHLVRREEIRSRTLTFLMFTDYGMPVTFYNDHYDLLLRQDALFARKISPEATELRLRLGRLYAETGRSFEISDEGRNLFAFLTGRGREGRRFAPRFWESEGSLGRDKELLLVVCKKWHVAKRLLGLIRHRTGLPGIEYLFNEESTPLPDLGGIERGLEKRMRHRRVLVNMLFGALDTRRLVLCLDPAMLDMMQDFDADPSTTRILEIDCDFDDDYLLGHARRVGLLGQSAPREALEQVLPAVRNSIRHEAERMQAAGFSRHLRIRQSASVDENAMRLAQFLSIPMETAREIASAEDLYAD